MTNGFIGSDPAALDALATKFDSLAQSIARIHGDVLSKTQASTWNGGDLDNFMRIWQGQSKNQLVSASQLIARSATDLRRHAEEQRIASRAEPALGRGHSGGGGGGGGGGGWGQDPGELADDLEDALDDLKNLLDAMGLPAEMWDWAVAALRDIDPSLLKDLGRFLGQNDALLKMFKAFGDLTDVVGKVIDIGDMAVDFLRDLAENAHLPADERAIHAGLVVGLGLAKTAVVHEVSGIVTSMILGSVFPGAGHLAGKIIGHAVGFAVSKGVDYLDDEFGVVDGAADLALEAYQEAKERAESAGEYIEKGIDEIKETGEELKEKGEKMLDGATNFVGKFI